MDEQHPALPQHHCIGGGERADPIAKQIPGKLVEKFLWGLCDAINAHTPHQCELIKVPTDESSFFRTLRSYWRFFRLDLRHFDLVIVTKYPAWTYAPNSASALFSFMR